MSLHPTIDALLDRVQAQAARITELEYQVEQARRIVDNLMTEPPTCPNSQCPPF